MDKTKIINRENNMFFQRIFKNKKRGFTLVEMLIFMFIFTIAGLTFYKVFTIGTKSMGDVRSRLGAIALANERIEIIRNLKYEDVATLGGIPAGNLLQVETVSRSGKTYYVHCSVVAVDDPFDGTLAAGTDTRPADYKQVKIVVYWEDNNLAKSTTAVTTISPPGVEAMYTGGILSLNVVDSSGVGIGQANVKIINNTVSPSVNAQYTTDSTGNLFLPEVIPALQTYSLQISKSGYFSVQTYAPYPLSAVSPIDVHASVVNASINQKTIVMDKFSTINVYTKSPLGDIVPNIDFALAGGRKIADTVASPALPVWSFAKANFNSAVAGKSVFSEVSPGPYYFTYPAGAQNDNYKLLYLDVATDATNSFNLSSDVSLDANVILANKETDALFVTVLNDADNKPLADASVELRSVSGTYDVTLATNKFGKVYFPDASANVVAGDYKLSVKVVGFTDIIDQDVTVNKLTSQEIKMVAE